MSFESKVLAIKEAHSDKFVHAEMLHKFVAEALAEANITLKHLSGIAISHGPGSYTGLRIGTSAAKGFCYALGIPLVAVPTTEVLLAAANYKAQENEFYIAAIDARRNEIFAQVFDAQKKAVSEIEAVVLDKNSFAYLDARKLIFVGDGAEKAPELVSNTASRAEQILPSAQHMVTRATNKFNNNIFEDVAYFEPFYLKDFVAGKAKKML